MKYLILIPICSILLVIFIIILTPLKEENIEFEKSLDNMQYKYRDLRFLHNNLQDQNYKLKYELFKIKFIKIRNKGYNTVEYFVTNGFPALVNVIYDNSKTGQYIRWYFPESVRNPLNFATNFFNTNWCGFTIEVHDSYDYSHCENFVWTCDPYMRKEMAFGDLELSIVKTGYSLLLEYNIEVK